MNSHDKSMNFQAMNFPTSQAPGCQGLKGGHQCLGQVVDGVFWAREIRETGHG